MISLQVSIFIFCCILFLYHFLRSEYSTSLIISIFTALFIRMTDDLTWSDIPNALSMLSSQDSSTFGPILFLGAFLSAACLVFRFNITSSPYSFDLNITHLWKRFSSWISDFRRKPDAKTSKWMDTALKLESSYMAYSHRSICPDNLRMFFTRLLEGNSITNLKIFPVKLESGNHEYFEVSFSYSKLFAHGSIELDESFHISFTDFDAFCSYTPLVDFLVGHSSYPDGLFANYDNSDESEGSLATS